MSQSQISQIVQDMEAPLQRNPVHEGGSGLHYSGRIYTNQFNQLSSDTCGGITATAQEVDDVYPGPVISTDQIQPDDTTKRISPTQLASYINTKINDGTIPGTLSNFDEQMKADAAFYAAAQTEYCFFEARYKAALDKFLDMVSQQGGSDSGANDYLNNTVIRLNRRLNCLLEIMNSVANERATKVNKRSPTIDSANSALQTKIEVLRQQQISLTANNARTRTQEEMVRFSAEKSHAMNIQIIFFVALNVVALGTILTVYKNTRPGV